MGENAASMDAPGTSMMSASQRSRTTRISSSTVTSVAGPASISSPGLMGLKMWWSRHLSPPTMKRRLTR